MLAHRLEALAYAKPISAYTGNIDAINRILCHFGDCMRRIEKTMSQRQFATGRNVREISIAENCCSLWRTLQILVRKINIFI